MYYLAILYNFLAPINSLSINTASGRIYVSWIFTLFLDIGAISLLIAGFWHFSNRAMLALTPFIIFVIFGFVTFLFSPYLAEAMKRSFAQVGGILGMVLMVLAYERIVHSKPSLLFGLIKCSMISLSIIGYVALFQFIVNNALNSHVVDFRFFAQLLGNDQRMDYGKLGPLWRSNSFLFEGDHLALYSTVMTGLVVVRLGLVGRLGRIAVKSFVPLWAAWGIVAGIVTALSSTGLADFLLVAIATAITARFTGVRRRAAAFRRQLALAVGAIVVVGAIAIPVVVGGGLAERFGGLQTVPIILGGGSATYEEGFNADTFSVVANLAVAWRNVSERPLTGAGLGAHAASYDAYSVADLDAVTNLLPSQYGLNKDDAVGLVLRLPSETGLIGTSIFLLGCFMVLRSGWQTARMHGRFAETDLESCIVHYIAVGTTASCFGIVVFSMVKFGVYFEPNLWLCFAMTAATAGLRSKMVRDNIELQKSHGSALAVPSVLRQPL